MNIREFNERKRRVINLTESRTKCHKISTKNATEKILQCENCYS